ncbi:uncharacterized protein SPSK_08036 [Sporothrix schenckii 1099-18]|uniref:Uncharacterized protein n=1 Tax=Sporothrix schenckii 1099-18 TaxID=1397361 RepID=A0A0F2MGA2_SPOSC|nr:uncharacterized protein SPSK_08036 [Sporothrix schenckii 1099-18]KJR88728.1 hypothetical protein SPSK_08036 [Sporothrix schenckii 1099-18]
MTTHCVHKREISWDLGDRTHGKQANEKRNSHGGRQRRQHFEENSNKARKLDVEYSIYNGVKPGQTAANSWWEKGAATVAWRIGEIRIPGPFSGPNIPFSRPASSIKSLFLGAITLRPGLDAVALACLLPGQTMHAQWESTSKTRAKRTDKVWQMTVADRRQSSTGS